MRVSEGKTEPQFEGAVEGVEDVDIAVLALVIEIGQQHHARLQRLLVLHQQVAARHPTVSIMYAAAIAIARMIGGKQNTRSVARIRPSSAQPRA